jgi:nuclear-control-of-ATPase protein 2
MTSFIDEQVKLLDLSLTSSFKTHETKFALQAATPTTTDSPSEQPFVLKATQALDLLNAPPSIEKVQEYLEQFRVSTESADPALEWLFVSKCTIAAYGQVFSEVLNMTLPVSKAIDYWNQVHGSPLQEIYYTLESKQFL